MSAENSLAKKEEKVSLVGVNVSRVGENYNYLKETLADHYFRAWRNLGLCSSLTEAQRRLDNYNDQGVFESSFIVSDNEKGKIYSLLLTTNVRADSLFELLLKIPKYRSFENRIFDASKGQIGFSVCFSITAEPGYRVKMGGDNISLSQFNLFGYETPEGFYKCAYSRLHGVKKQSLPGFYVRNVANPYLLGATGMHEGAYGGLTLAIIKGSRPEDALGGEANTFILLPRDETQREINTQVISNRRGGFVPYEKIGPYMIFRDIWPYLSLAR